MVSHGSNTAFTVSVDWNDVVSKNNVTTTLQVVSNPLLFNNAPKVQFAGRRPGEGHR
jgi:hypothetical protein